MNNSNSLHNRHALVCGASSGIGRETAIALARMGASVTVLARRKERLDSLLPELTAAGSPAVFALTADLDDRFELGVKINMLLESRGNVEILINNAGGPPGGPILNASPEDFQLAFGRHVLASHILAQLLVPGMTESGYGRIINIISTSVREPIPNLGLSNTIRGAMASWAKSLSRELPAGITINNVLPGFTDTERLGGLRQAVATRTGASTDDVLKGWIAQVPEGRLAEPSEPAGAIAFLASPAAAYIRGVSLPVDGGRLRGI
jgi:3-oxoacyl-[acyl-carrier protein] reductase